MVFTAIQRWLVVSLGVLVLAACNGGDVGGFNELRDLRLSNLEVVAGGTLTFEEDAVEEFDQNNFGPYRIVLTDQSVTSVTLRPTITVDDVNLQLVEVNKGENDQDIIRENLTSGEDVTVDISEGSNVILMRLASTINNVVSEYVIQVNKVSSSATLAEVNIQNVRSANSTDNVRFDPSSGIAEDVFSYDVAISQENCGVTFLPFPANRRATVTVNGEPSSTLQFEFIPLDNNDPTPVVVRIVSEDNNNTAEYTFTLTRATSSDSDIANDSTLKSIDVSSSRKVADFRCNLTTSSNQTVSNNVTAVTLVAETSRSGATMTIGRARIEDGAPARDTDGRFESVDPEPLTSGQTFDGAILQNLEEGENFFIITVTSADGDSITAYQVEIERLTTNEVFVENAEQLQQALRNAGPNDDIVVAPGDYVGTVGDASSATGSGDPSAHFFSSGSGTEDQPIRLRIEGGDPVRLMGTDLNQNSVLKITGDHWVISSRFEFSQAQNGIVLDGANNVLMELVEVESVGERGIVMQNGSSNNQVRLSTIDRTGLEPQTRDGVTEVFGEGVVIGAGDMTSTGNSVRNMTFGRNIANEAIDIKANATDTNIQFNVFESDNTIVRPVTDRSLINIEGAATEVSYNQFEYNDIESGTDDFSQFIVANAATGAVTEVFQNIFNLDSQAINIVNGIGMGETDVADNTRQDTGDILYAGTVDQNFTTPSFQIRSTLDSNNCLTRQEVNILRDNLDASPEGIVVAACDGSEAQQWTFTIIDDGFVFISPRSSLSTKVSFVSLVNGDTTLTFAANREDTGEVLDSAFFLRWRMLFNGEEVVFSNRFNPAFFLTEAPNITVADLEGGNQPIFAKIPVTGESGTFTLVRQ